MLNWRNNNNSQNRNLGMESGCKEWKAEHPIEQPDFFLRVLSEISINDYIANFMDAKYPINVK